MGQTLYEKVFNRHVVREVAPGQYQLLADLHLLNEVSSPPAFEALRERGLHVRHPGLTFGSSDHSISTSGRADDFADKQAAGQVAAMGRNMTDFGLTYFDPAAGEHGIIHVVGPERGLTRPGMVIVCGDSHTSTHGAFGAIAFGIGTSQVRDVLASQTLLMEKLKVRRIEITGSLAPGVYAKDVALHVIHALGAKGGVGFAYEFAGAVVDRFSMEERMTLCNLAIEAGARCGYVNPDRTTYEYLHGRDHAPRGAAWDRAVAAWEQVRSDADAVYDDVVTLDGDAIAPMVTWGTSPDQSAPVDGHVADAATAAEHGWTDDVLDFMGFGPGQPVLGTRIDVAFLGSCTNGRLSDFVAVAEQIRDRGFRVAPHVRALVVPGSQRVRAAMVAAGLDRVFADAGFEVRDAGCSLCCGMNADRLTAREVCASSSNRNFRGRQGSPTGRTLLMSPVMVAAAAIAGEVTDARQLFART
ncbi:MAG: 3-isopropylmalate dehydratase large subunit [Proteobacteria bacterium]|nr:3-isopropylmalate dehydratase large subunit [Pseudomonadota bacterium]